jgi:plastocyanin
MRKKLLFTLLLGGAPVVFAGDITGTVRAEPKAGLENAAGGGGAYDSKKYKFVARVDYSQMRDFVVFIEGKVGSNSVASTNNEYVTTSRVAQKGAQFAPHILPVLAGTTVEWPNNDDIFHNVFSISEAKEFDLDLYKGNPPDKRVRFDRPGKVDVYCSIHANMNCIVLVLENPYFAATDADGKFTIKNVPPGKYKLKAWHERLPADEQEITVPEDGAVRANFTLTIKNLPKI